MTESSPFELSNPEILRPEVKEIYDKCQEMRNLAKQVPLKDYCSWFERKMDWLLSVQHSKDPQIREDFLKCAACQILTDSSVERDKHPIIDLPGEYSVVAFIDREINYLKTIMMEKKK